MPPGPGKGGGGGGVTGSWSKDRPEGASIAIKETGPGLLDNWAWLGNALSTAMSFPGTIANRGWPKLAGPYTAAGRDLIPSPTDGMWIARRDVPRIEYFDENAGAWLGFECAAIGELRRVGFDPSTPPPGWLECNGAAVSETTYAGLFAVIGYAYGNPGSGNFNLPDARGRVGVGLDRSGSPDADFDTVGEDGGEKLQVLTEEQMPTHDHACSVAGAHQHDLPEAGSGAQQDDVYEHALSIHGSLQMETSSHQHTVDDSGESRDVGHENRMKFLVVGAIIYAGL